MAGFCKYVYTIKVDSLLRKNDFIIIKAISSVQYKKAKNYISKIFKTNYLKDHK